MAGFLDRSSECRGPARAFILAALMVLLAAGAGCASVNVQYPSSVGIGKPLVIRATSSVPLTGVEAIWQGRTTQLAITVWNEHYVALGLMGTQVGKVKPGDHRLKLRLVDGDRTSEHSLTIKITPVQYKEDRLTLPEKMVSPPQSELKRIEAERKLVGAALATMTGDRLWALPILRPVQGIVTSPYGRRRIINGKAGSPHGGVDFRAASGTPVKAALPGRVVLTGDHYFAGKSVYVDSGGGVISMYFHLSSIDVAQGDMVKAGQVVAKSGSTGRSTGPHLHFGLSLSGQAVDSEPLFDSTSANLLANSAFVKLTPAWR
ncbi:MAG: M23 family metallopeptidase [Synergistota bacterium]|nr:M23 family metallopeptidase [Synergistota bacterium]